METAETRKKLADAVRQLQASGDTEAVNRLVFAYKNKYQSNKPFRYEVPPETSQEKITRYKSEASKAQAEADKYKGFGFVKEFGKELVKGLAPAEVGLGETIGKVLGNNTGKYSEQIQSLTDSQIKIQKLIKEREAKGIDTTDLRKGYNNNADLIDELRGEIDKYNKDLPTTGQAVGQLAGTALDVLSAGTYGKATKGMKSFGLTKPAETIGAIVGNHLKSAKQIAKELPDAPIKNVADDAIKNIAASLNKAGLGDDAAKLLSLDTSKIRNINQLSTLIAETVKLPAVIPSVIPRGKIGVGEFVKELIPSTAVGYGYDVTSKLQEGKTGSEAATPGIGTAIGALLPVAGKFAEKAGSKALIPAEEKAANKVTDIVSKRENDLKQIENGYKTFRKAEDYNPQLADSRNRIASTDLLVNSVDENGVIRTKEIGGAIEKYKEETVDKAEGVVMDLLKKEGAIVRSDTLLEKMRNAIRNSTLPAKEMQSALKEADAIVGAYSAQFVNGKIPLDFLQEQKIKESKLINYQTPPEKSALSKAVTRALKETIEENSKYNIKEVNQELQKYYKDIEYLELLDGKRVKGGRLGKYFARIGGYVAGNVLGGAIGGPAGSIAGTIAGGEVADNITKMMLKSSFGGKTGANIPTSKIIDTAVMEANSPRLELPAPKEGYPKQSNNVAIPLRAPIKDEAQAPIINRGNANIPASNEVKKKITSEKVLPKDKETEKLITVHKTNIEKLRNSHDLGGVVNPSLATINPKNGNIEGYGDITLVVPKALRDAGTTFGSDIYSPRSPHYVWKFKGNAEDKLNEIIKNSSFPDDKISEYSLDNMNYLPSIRETFLKSENIKIPNSLYKSKYPDSELQTLISDNNLSSKFDEYIKNTLKDIGAERKIFAGYTASGNRRYLPFDAKNASKLMNKDSLRGGENFFYGTGNVRSSVSKKLKNDTEIKKESGKLIGSSEMKKVSSDADKKFQEILDLITSKTGLRWDNAGESLSDYYSTGRKFFWKEEYDKLSTEDLKKIDEFKKYLIDLPTEYFETKIKRPVSPNEFDLAVIEPDTEESIIKELEKMGYIPVKKLPNETVDQTVKRVGKEGLLFSLIPFILLENSKESNS